MKILILFFVFLLTITTNAYAIKLINNGVSNVPGGGGDASYPINLAGGTATVGILPQTQGGWGTDTTGTIAIVAGKLGIGTTTPATTFHVAGTSTLSNVVVGTSSTLTYHGQIVRRFPANGTLTVTNADVYALVGLGAEGNLVSLLGSKVDAVGGSSTGQTLTNPTILGIFTFPGDGFTWAAGSSTIIAAGTMTVGTTDGSNANVVLDADGTATHFLRRNNIDFDMRSIPRTLVAGSASVTGNTFGTVATFVIPPNSLGPNGCFELSADFRKMYSDAAPAYHAQLHISDGISTSTSSIANVITSTNISNQAYYVFRNNGSTSINYIRDTTGGVFTAQTTDYLLPNLNTAGTITVSWAIRASAGGTATVNMPGSFCRYTFIP